MDLQQIQTQLLLDFSSTNLTLLSSKIIAFHKKKNFNALRKVGNIVSEFVPFNEESNARLFSKLIVLFHPDKMNDYHKQIVTTDNWESLQTFSYLKSVLVTIDSIAENTAHGILTPDEFEEEYGWNYRPSDDDYFITQEEAEPVSHWFDEENPDDNYFYTDGQGVPDGSFLTALKRKIYGPSYIDFPVHLLEDLEEIEMAEYEIEDLEGIEFCVYAKVIDLSYNLIFDIARIAKCTFVQELYLAANQIHYIDALASMQDLRMLDLSGNRVQDLSPLFKLNSLEYVNLLGNPVLNQQVMQLKQNGVVVVY